MARKQITLLELAKLEGTTVQAILAHIEKATGQKFPLEYNYQFPIDHIKSVAPELFEVKIKKPQSNKQPSGNRREEDLEVFNSGDEKTILGFVKAIEDNWITIKFFNNEESALPIEQFSGLSHIVKDYIVEFCETEEPARKLDVLYCMPRSNWSLMKLRKAYEHRDTIKGKVLCKFDNGLILNVFGRKAVMYESQIDSDSSQALSSFINKELDVRVIQLKENSDGSAKVILSQKIIPGKDTEKQQREKLLQLKTGTKACGIVTKITDFGAFVQFENLVGFVPKSHLAIRRINHPSEVVKINETIPVSILHIAQEENKTRITLEHKQSLWESVIPKIDRGTIISGTIRKIENYGIFIEIVPGLDGLLHVSQMTRRQYSELLQLTKPTNNQMDAVIIDIDKEEHRITLSLLPLIENKWDNIENRYLIGRSYPARVVDVRENEVWAELEEGVEGIILPNELKWPKTNLPQNELLFDKKILVAVKDIETNERKLILSLRECTPNPWVLASGYLKKGMTTKVRIENIGSSKRITVCTVDEFQLLGSISLSEVSWIKNREELEISDLPTEGEIIEAKIIEWIPEKFIMNLSIRRLTDDPWDKIEAGAEIDGTISEVVEDIGLKVVLSNGLTGISQELNLAEHMGQSLNFKVIGYNKHTRAINLSHKRLSSDKHTDELVRRFFSTNLLTH